MTAIELRRKYIDFFRTKGHTEISGRSLIPENDPTVLFTVAGMVPLVPNLLGEPHPGGQRLVDVQKCLRTVDIEKVGDLTHNTFFEMLGNWSLGDYFKQEAIEWSYAFLTDKSYLGFDPGLLHVTVFEGDQDAPRDVASARAWESLGIPAARIHFLPKEDNWWGLAAGGPCGPNTEMFIDTGRPPCNPDCGPGCGCGKFFEVWNDVFMEYDKKPDGTFQPLAMKSVDTGMGVERTIVMLQGRQSVYDTELLRPVVRVIEQVSGLAYGATPEGDRSLRIVADHLRAAVFVMADPQDTRPSNLGRGYVLRRLIRRAIRHGWKLGIERSFVREPAAAVFGIYEEMYPEMLTHRDAVLAELGREEEQFVKTIRTGERELEKALPNLLKNPARQIPGRVAFRLYDTYGYPLELTEEMAAEHGLTVDREGFLAAEQRHQELSKKGSEQSFKGGLADHTEATTRLHTATHLLHKALRLVLGTHVEQKGSNITTERLRFDFSHPLPMSQDEIQNVERIVNEQIRRDLPVSMEVMDVAEAKRRGAMALFTDKYDERVKVYAMGDFSLEVCGGPHVQSTGSLGSFKISKEQSSSAGIRRIRAVLEAGQP
jgi:alanyl-tRNA synthetase